MSGREAGTNSMLRVSRKMGSGVIFEDTMIPNRRDVPRPKGPSLLGTRSHKRDVRVTPCLAQPCLDLGGVVGAALAFEARLKT